MPRNKSITDEKIRISKEMITIFIKEKKPSNNEIPLAFHLWLQKLEMGLE